MYCICIPRKSIVCIGIIVTIIIDPLLTILSKCQLSRGKHASHILYTISLVLYDIDKYNIHDMGTCIRY